MTIEIDDDYIAWLNTHMSAQGMAITPEEVAKYVTEVLNSHRQSWTDLEEKDDSV